MPKPMKQTAPKGSATSSADYISDPRFSNIQTDPRFRLPSKKNTHVQIDKRFAHALRDENFCSRAKVDRYGRRLEKAAGRKELQKFYRLADEDDDGSDDQVDKDEEVELELERVNGKDEGSSSSDESSSDDGDGEEQEEEVFGLLEEQEGADGIPKGEVSSRLAVVNLDWDNIRAADLMAVFSSFVPGSGRIRKISIYPSEFGMERMEKEEMEGPPKEIFGQGKIDVQDDEESSGSGEESEDDEAEDERIKKSMIKEDEGQEFNSAKLRRYQLERLRYYYAVLDCSSKSIAQAVYDAVDGTEYLTTANFFDLRYIPDNMDFVEEKPRDECERIPNGYRPNEFVTDALQHSKVRLTWDAEDGTRKEAQKRAFGGSRAEIDENDLKAYLGSDSSEDEGPEPVVVDATNDTTVSAVEGADSALATISKSSKKEAERERMRALLGLQNEPATGGKSKVDKNAPVSDMQITFSSGLSSGANNGSVFENEPERDETTVEKYVRREKERKARRKEKMKESRNGTDVPEDTEMPQTAPDTAENQDLGFSDPFFAPATHDQATTTSQRKAEKRLKREQRAAAEAAAAAERAELELLMVDDKTGSKDMQHFDIAEIAKAEKALAKQKKKKKTKSKLSEREKEAVAAKEKDRFKINTRDERFRDVFEKNEYAIDPSHPRYKGTDGMREMLEEGRRKRKADDKNGEDIDGERPRVKKRKRPGEAGHDVEELVARVKSKART